MRLSDPRTVAEADVCLRAARAWLRRAQAVTTDTGQLYIAAAWGRIDRFLEERLEIERAERDCHVEELWCWSWPGSAPPEWPAQIGAQGVGS